MSHHSPAFAPAAFVTVILVIFQFVRLWKQDSSHSTHSVCICGIKYTSTPSHRLIQSTSVSYSPRLRVHIADHHGPWEVVKQWDFEWNEGQWMRSNNRQICLSQQSMDMQQFTWFQKQICILRLMWPHLQQTSPNPIICPPLSLGAHTHACTHAF